MPVRTKTTYSTPKGTYNFRKKTFTGKGPAPSGSRKVRAPSAATAPTVTTSSTGEVTTSGFGSRRAATRARRDARSARRWVRRITQATENRSAQRRRQASRRSEASVRSAEKIAAKAGRPGRSATTKTVISSRPSPSATPETFQGRKTAGAPTRSELLRAKRTGTLKVNRKGFATTPAVRKTTKTVQKLESKARRSSGPLPTLTPAQSARAHTVLRRGERVKATRKEKLAAIETGLVEAPNFENPAGGDLDSEGWRQERTSIYGTGPQGPRNVKASADRFFDEVRSDPGTQSAPTPGLLAQAAQGSAFPERYDERAPEAKAILRAHNKGKLKPTQQRKLKKARRKAAELGLTALTKGKRRKPHLGKLTGVDVSTSTPAIKRLGRVVAGRVGSPLKVISASRPGATTTSGSISDHASGNALDIHALSTRYGTPADEQRGNRIAYEAVLAAGGTKAQAEEMASNGGALSVVNKQGVRTQIIWRSDTGGDHHNHVHIGVSGATGTGGFVPGVGSFTGSLPEGSVTSLLQATGMSTTEINQAAATRPGMAEKLLKQLGFRLTPAQKARRTFRQLEQMGLGVGQEASGSKESSSATLSALERKYGVKT